MAEAAKMGMERLVVSGPGRTTPASERALPRARHRVGELQKVLF